MQTCHQNTSHTCLGACRRGWTNALHVCRWPNKVLIRVLSTCLCSKVSFHRGLQNDMDNWFLNGIGMVKDADCQSTSPERYICVSNELLCVTSYVSVAALVFFSMFLCNHAVQVPTCTHTLPTSHAVSGYPKQPHAFGPRCYECILWACVFKKMCSCPMHTMVLAQAHHCIPGHLPPEPVHLWFLGDISRGAQPFVIPSTDSEST